jgi:hypothetical protein
MILLFSREVCYTTDLLIDKLINLNKPFVRISEKSTLVIQNKFKKWLYDL